MPQHPGTQRDPRASGRRGLLGALGLAGACAAPLVASAGTAERATLPGRPEDRADPLKARYRPDAPDVQAFYRVNRY